MSTISASTTTTTAFKITTDTTGALVFQTGASPITAMTLGADQSVTFAGTPTYTGGTANGVAYLNGSKVLTTGSSLVFDGTNLGVGTASPASPLQVNSATAPTSGPIFRIDNTATTTYSGGSYVGGQVRLNFTNATGRYAGINFSNTGASSQEFFGAVQNASGYNDFVWQGFSGSYGERMRLDSSGNLGLGVTPSAWDSVFKSIDGGGSGCFGSLFFQTNGDYTTALGSNLYYNGGWKYKSTAAAGKYELKNNTHTWYNAASGTAGSAISFNQAMTLDATGSLYVGGTTGAFGGSQKGFSAQSGSVITVLNGENDSSIGSTGTVSNHPFTFKTNSTERARIDTSGNLIIIGGTSGDSTKLYIRPSDNTSLSTYFGKEGYWTVIGANPNEGWKFRNDTPVNVFTVNGGTTNYNASLLGSLTQNASDSRLKTNVEQITGAINKVCALTGITYNWNELAFELSRLNPNTREVGVFAQDVQQVLPEAVSIAPFDMVDGKQESASGENYLTIQYEKLTPLLIEAIKELNARIETLESA